MIQQFLSSQVPAAKRTVRVAILVYTCVLVVDCAFIAVVAGTSYISGGIRSGGEPWSSANSSCA